MLLDNKAIFSLILLSLYIHFIIDLETFLPIGCSIFMVWGLFSGFLDCPTQIELYHLNSHLGMCDYTTFKLKGIEYDYVTTLSRELEYLRYTFPLHNDSSVTICVRVYT